jgi:Tol biopolymer transport system component
MSNIRLAVGARVFGTIFGSVLLTCGGLGAEAALEVVSRPLVARPHSGGDSSSIELSADGRWAVWVSSGNGLATNDHNGLNLDIFLRDLETGETTLVTRGTSGNGGSGDSYAALVSADGRFVLLESTSDNLVEGDENEGADVFLYDRTTGGLSMLSQGEAGGAVGEAGLGGMSADGRFVLFESTADDLAEGDVNDAPDFFLLDRSTGEVTLVSGNGQGTGTGAFDPNFVPFLGMQESTMSDDGRYVAFSSVATDLVPSLPANLGNISQLYLWDRAAGTNRLITPTTNTTEKTSSSSPVLSANGEYLAFLSEGHAVTVPNITARLYLYNIATGTLVAIPTPSPVSTAPQPFGDPAFSADGRSLAFSFDNQIYVHDVLAGANILISVSAGGEPAAGGYATPLISADGRRVVFSSYATNLVGAINGESYQLFGFDRQTGEMKLLSRAADGAGGANSDVHFPVLSADGLKAGFTSFASNIGPSNNSGVNDVFVVATAGNDPVQLASPGHPTSISSTGAGNSRVTGNALSLDGRYLVFTSDAMDLAENDTNNSVDLFLRDISSGTTRLISRTVGGAQRSGPIELNGMSANGRTVIYSATETIDGSNLYSVLAYDTGSGTTRVASILPSGEPAEARSASVTADGRQVSFIANASSQIYVRDLETETTTAAGQVSIDRNDSAILSPNGGYLLLHRNTVSYALIDRATGARSILSTHLFLGNPFLGDDSALLLTRSPISSLPVAIYLYSTATLASNLVSTNVVGSAAISLDGSTIAFPRRISDANFLTETVIYDVATSNLATVPFGPDLARFRAAAFSRDGRYLALAVTNDLAGGAATYSFTDIYVYDRVLTNLTLVSRTPAGAEGNAPSGSPSISANGRVVAFDSVASDLVPNDRNLLSDVFVARFAIADADNNGLEDGWESLNFGGPGDPGADSDSDGATDLQEYLAGTDPRDAQSLFALYPSVRLDENLVSLQWTATAGRAYQVQFRSDFGAGEWTNLGAPQVATLAGEITINAPATAATGFYRLQALP